MLNKNFDFSHLQIEKEIDKMRKELLLNKNASYNYERRSIYGIQNFWIVNKSGLALFNLEDTLFKNNDELMLFGGFITAIISLSEHLSKYHLSEIKIEKISLHILKFVNIYLVSLVSWNYDLSLRFLMKFYKLIDKDINNETNSLTNDQKNQIKSLYLLKMQDKDFKREIIFELSFDYISKFVFSLIELDVFFKNIHGLIIYFEYSERIELLQGLELFNEKIRKINVSEEKVDQIDLIIKILYNFTKYSEFNLNKHYTNYLKEYFLLFLNYNNNQFFLIN